MQAHGDQIQESHPDWGTSLGPVPDKGLGQGQRRVLALLFLAGLVNFFDRTALSVANTSVRAELHLSAAAMGWLLSAFSLAYGCAQLPLVALLRRTGTRLAMGAGLTVWSATQLLTALARSLPPFLVLRVFLGLGESPFYPAGVQTVRDWFPVRSRGRATAVMSMSQTLGLAAAPPALAALILLLGWRWMFALLGLAGLLVALAWRTLYPVAAAPAGTRRPEPPDQQASFWASLLRRPMVWGMMLGFGGINYTNWLYTAWLPGYLQAARHLSLAKTGSVAALPFLAGAVGMWCSGAGSDALQRHGLRLTTVHRAQLVLGMTLSAASTFLVARSASTSAAVAAISAALFFIHFAGTSGWGYVQTVARPEQVASLGALQNFASFLLASAAPVLTGYLLDRTHSFTLALGVCTAVTLLGALSYATLASPDREVRSGHLQGGADKPPSLLAE